MTETQEHPAAEFDVEAWLVDAHLPEESADVYKRADVIGELSALKRQIEVQREAAAGAEATAADASELIALTTRYQELVDTFASSQLTIYVRALSPTEKLALRASHDERTKDLTPKEQNEAFGYDLLAAAITAVRPFEADRVSVSITPDQVRALEESLGEVQMGLVLAARQVAQNRAPIVDADFLQKPSGEDIGQG